MNTDLSERERGSEGERERGCASGRDADGRNKNGALASARTGWAAPATRRAALAPSTPQLPEFQSLAQCSQLTTHYSQLRRSRLIRVIRGLLSSTRGLACPKSWSRFPPLAPALTTHYSLLRRSRHGPAGPIIREHSCNSWTKKKAPPPPQTTPQLPVFQPLAKHSQLTTHNSQLTTAA